jgi:hypothetical protein
MSSVFYITKSKTLNPMDLSQWSFYVLPTKVLNEKLGVQKGVSLSRLLKLEPVVVDFNGLHEAVEGVDLV